ncbi:hypothetical protein [Synechococcus sp. BO 8801]|uniref:hypothetical protein n=1 Tax=Synechococcus sp. BO 8801 TaxID=169670 RepID=UPI0018E9BEF7|nr:hypothetical protein [Synechococcus sp. BO 8801]
MLVSAAALAAAPGASVNRVFHRAADRAAVAAAVGKHLFAALLAVGIEALAAELQQRAALAIAQLVAADQAVVAIALGGDAVEGEAGPPCASQDPSGHVVRLGGGMGHPGGVRRGVALAFRGSLCSFTMLTQLADSVSGSTPATQGGDPL